MRAIIGFALFVSMVFLPTFAASENLNLSQTLGYVKSHFPSIRVDVANCGDGACDLKVSHIANGSMVYATGTVSDDPSGTISTFGIERSAKIFGIAEICARKLRKTNFTLKIAFAEGDTVTLIRSQTIPKVRNYCESGISSGLGGQFVQYHSIEDETTVSIFRRTK